MTIVIRLILFSFLAFIHLKAEGDLIDQNWYSESLEKIKNLEYQITYSTEIDLYQASNRKNNLHFIYKKNGFSVRSLDTKYGGNESLKIKNWNASFTINGYGRNGIIEKKFEGTVFNTKNNLAFIEDNNMQIQYINDYDGMRQNFIVKTKPKQEQGFLTLNMTIETNESIKVSRKGLVIGDKINEYMKYNSLKIWDAEGNTLKGYFTADNAESSEINNNIQIVVLDNKAVYPITIDPLSSSEVWSQFSDQASSEYGYSVATAGDINGDGYSDVIVGAPSYVDGLADGGHVFIYLGSSTGLSTTADKTLKSYNTGAKFGFSVSTAGDVNKDGYSDIIVGAPKYSEDETNEGAIFVYHGSSTGIVTPAAEIIQSNQAEAQFGYSVSTAGDVDDDGDSDIIIGAPFYDNGENDEGKVFLFNGSFSGINSAPDWSVENNRINSQFGTDVRTAGDVNGDGYSDIIVGAPLFDDGVTDGGKIYVFYGSSTGLPSSPSWTAVNPQSYSQFGYSVSTAGDVNGDGFSDIVAGALTFSNGQNQEGKVFAFYGSISGLSASPDWSKEGNEIDKKFGGSISTAGDVNGDGYADVIVGAAGNNFSEGAAFLFYGSEIGLDEFDSLTTEDGLQALDQFGSSVAIAGDVNGDGFSDVIVGAKTYTTELTNAGAAFVNSGGPSASSSISQLTKLATDNQPDAYFGISVSTAGDVNGDGYSDAIVGAHGWLGYTGAFYIYFGDINSDSVGASMMIGETLFDGEEFGKNVSTAGDVNGDGFSDVIVTAYSLGKAYIIFGSSTFIDDFPLIPSTDATHADVTIVHDFYFGDAVSTAGDINGDGFSDVMISHRDEGNVYIFFGGPTLIGDRDISTADVTFTGGIGPNTSVSISSAGDVNGDGLSDIILAKYLRNTNIPSEAEAYVFYGSPSISGTINLSTADIKITEETMSDYFGYSVSTAGDVNGDGYSDFLIGAKYASGTKGKVYLFFGGNNISDSLAASSANMIISGGAAGDHLGHSVSSAGDVNGDGYSDIILGSARNSSGTAQSYIFLGSSTLASNVDAFSADVIMDLFHTNAEIGSSVSTVGDMNGDGFSDVIVGTPEYNNKAGRADIYFGNNGGGLNSQVQQYKPNTNNIVSAGGLTLVPGQARIGIRGKSPFGRAEGRIVYEYKQNGEPYTIGNNISNSVSYDGIGTFEDLLTNPLGKSLKVDLNSLPSGVSYKWRARVEYNQINNPYQKYGPWKYYNNYAAKLPDGFKTFPILSYFGADLLVDLTVLLEGPYNSTNNNLENNLSVSNDSPYSEDPANVTSIPSNVNDWILVELRDKDDPSSVIASRSVFLLDSGKIVDIDGISKVHFTVSSDDYYISVKHRNHLSIMSTSAITPVAE